MAEEEHPVRQLYADHDRLAQRLERLEALCLEVERGAGHDALRAELEEMADVLREEVDVHSNKEEVGLFPLLLRHPLPPGLLDMMLDEHAAIRDGVHDFVAGAGAWLGPQAGASAPAAWVGPARLVRGKLSTHMQKENLILFPLAMRQLTPEEVASAAAAFAELGG